MRFADVARLLVLGLGALASVATSGPYPDVQVDRLLPPTRETGVPTDAVIELHVTQFDADPDNAPVFLLQAQGGTPEELEATWEGDSQGVVRAVASGLTADTDYTLGFADAGWLHAARFTDPVTGIVYPDDQGDFAYINLTFSTRLTPEVRFARRAGQTITVSFSRDMDFETFSVDNLSLVNGTEPVAIRYGYAGGDLHELVIEAPALPPGASPRIDFGAGIVAVDGTPLAPASVMLSL